MTTIARSEERLTKLVEWVGAVAGPFTAATAVLYYFGWTRTNAVFRYFGVDPAILKFDLSDYLARAAGPAFAPTVALIIGTAFLYALNRAAIWLEAYCIRHPVTIHGYRLVMRGPSIVLTYCGAVALWCSVRVAFGLPDYLHVGARTGITEPIHSELARSWRRSSTRTQLPNPKSPSTARIRSDCGRRCRPTHPAPKESATAADQLRRRPWASSTGASRGLPDRSSHSRRAPSGRCPFTRLHDSTTLGTDGTTR
jgi:hypothetical protein